MSKSSNKDFPAYGESPLGGNGQEGTAPGFAPVRSTAVIEVPLVYDGRVGTFISKLAVSELDDKDAALRLADKTNEDESQRQKMGMGRS